MPTNSSSAGISKKKSQRPLSRRQRLRREKNITKADAVTEQLEQKVGRSKESAKKIQDRRVTWEDVNNAIAHGMAKVQSTRASSKVQVTLKNSGMAKGPISVPSTTSGPDHNALNTRVSVNGYQQGGNSSSTDEIDLIE